MIGQFKTREHEIIGDIARAIVATPMSQRMEVLDAMTRAGFASVKAARPNDANQQLIATVAELQAKIVARAIELRNCPDWEGIGSDTGSAGSMDCAPHRLQTSRPSMVAPHIDEPFAEFVDRSPHVEVDAMPAVLAHGVQDVVMSDEIAEGFDTDERSTDLMGGIPR